MAEPIKWTEATVGRAIVHSVFNRSVLAIPNCGWTGHECDLLLIERGLRIIDVEVKISRADLRADLKKDKWWVHRPWSRFSDPTWKPARTEWPPKVWKHYYAVPKELWDDKLLESLPAVSGVILLDKMFPKAPPVAHIKRRAKPNKEAKPISPAETINLARLAGLRMWAALDQKASHDANRTTHSHSPAAMAV